MCLSAFCTSGSSYLRPMKRLTLKIVFSGLVIAWRRATWPTRRSPVFGFTATTDGVRRLPSAFSSTVGSPASMIAVTELVVPRSMPSTFAMLAHLPWRYLELATARDTRPADRSASERCWNPVRTGQHQKDRPVRRGGLRQGAPMDAVAACLPDSISAHAHGGPACKAPATSV